MSKNVDIICNIQIGWFTLIFVNFIFGTCGIVICTLKLKQKSGNTTDDFFILSIVFASCTLVLSVLLLAAVFKNNQKLIFLCAFLNFLSLFCGVIYVEIGTSFNVTFVVVFVVIGVLFIFWFCTFATYQLMNTRKQQWEDENNISPV